MRGTKATEILLVMIGKVPQFTQETQEPDMNLQSSNEGHVKERWNLEDVLPSRSGKIFQMEILDRLEALLVEFENGRPLMKDSISQSGVSWTVAEL